MPKMLFINPEAKVNRDIPNIGLAYAATHCRVKIIDLNTRLYPRDRFLKQETDVLGISVQSRTWRESVRIAQLYKDKYPQAKVKSISGFLDIQCCYPYLDFEDKIVFSEPFSDSYSFPDYELFDSFEMFRKNWQSGVWNYAIMTSQGCPYQCIYCWSRKRKWRARSARNCYEELKSAKKRWNIKSFAILDDCFNIDKRRVIEFCELIKPLQLTWNCANGLRADRFDEDMAKAMAASGCEQASFGVESVLPEVLEVIKKGESIETIEQALDIAKKHFKKVNGFFIIGLPKSNYAGDLSSLEWAKKKGINAHFSYYVPFNEVVGHNHIFYGEGARPVSEEYPEKLQKKIYKMTKRMRPAGSGKGVSYRIRRQLRKLGLL
ncbi:MAG: radical SAM protein [Nitrospirae bacterium]|nr:radical SAM protein [Nitrospirota bacterium]